MSDSPLSVQTADNPSYVTLRTESGGAGGRIPPSIGVLASPMPEDLPHGTIWVGERGPEVWTSSNVGYVVSYDESMRLLGP